MNYLLFSTVVVLSFASVFAKPRLLAQKVVLNDLIVEGKDITVKYFIVNIGTLAATNVKVVDTASYPAEKMEIVHGKTDFSWDRILPNSNVTHVVITKPILPGRLNISSAEITYSSEAAEDEEIRHGFSSEGEVFVMTRREYDRRMSSHLLDWAVFFAICAPFVLIPYILYSQSASKYCDSKSKKL